MPDGSATLSTKQSDECDQWIADAEKLKAEILALCAKGTKFCPLLGRIFGPTFRRIVKFQIAELGKPAFIFDPEIGLLTLNAAPIAMLRDYVLGDVEFAQRDHPLPPSLVKELHRKAFRLFLLHEIRHIPQGLSSYTDVVAIKKIAGDGFMAELDLIADRDAASAYAALEADADGGGRQSYLNHFMQALFFSGQYCFPVFRFTDDRPFKMARAVGLTFMAARLARSDLSKRQDNSTAALDSCIIVRLSDDYSSLVVILTEPDTQVISIMCEVPDGRLRRLIDFIVKNDFLSAIDVASIILSAMKGLS